MSGSRFRRSSAVGKSLADLGNLVQAATAHSPEPVKVTPNAFNILPGDDDLKCVWKMMSDCKQRTVTEATAALADFPDQVDPEDIEILLRAMHRQGFVTCQYHGGEAIYTLKKGVRMSALTDNSSTGINRSREVQVTLQGLSRDGKINLSEGIMVCLWKAVSDCKTRTQNQIIEILAAYGINSEVAKNAFIKAKVNKGWFEVRGSGAGETLKMKKHIKMPPVENVDPAVLRQKLTPGGVRVEGKRAEDIMLTGQIPAPGPIYTDKARRHSDSLKVSREEWTQPTLPAVQQLAPEGIVMPTVTKEDSLDVAIWKVMCDGRQYTASDVGLLLEEFGHNIGSVKSRISQIFLRDGHWFTREKRRNARNGTEYLYTLRNDVCMPGTTILPPTTTKASVPVEIPATPKVKEEDMVKSNAATQGATLSLGEKLTDAMKNQPSQTKVDQPAPPPVAPPTVQTPPVATPPVEKYFTLADLADTSMLKFKVEISSNPPQSVSFKQADKLARDLQREGFGKGDKRDDPDSLLKKNYQVGVTSYTGDQLEDLTMQLMESGFGVDE